MWWISRLRWQDGLEVLFLTWVIYKILLLIRGTRAMQVLKGIVILIVAAFVARMLNLNTIDHILKYVFGLAAVAILVVFQPELRRGLASIGERPWFGSSQAGWQVIEEVVRAVARLSEQKRGALLMIEREVGLGDLVQTGVRIDGRVSGDLLESIFAPGEPLHDGAVIIQGDRVAAAGCVLPLAKETGRLRVLGMRHLAALGATQESDALVIAVSEESGSISIFQRGDLESVDDRARLRSVLMQVFAESQKRPWFFSWWLRRESPARDA